MNPLVDMFVESSWRSNRILPVPSVVFTSVYPAEVEGEERESR